MKAMKQKETQSSERMETGMICRALQEGSREGRLSSEGLWGRNSEC